MNPRHGLPQLTPRAGRRPPWLLTRTTTPVRMMALRGLTHRLCTVMRWIRPPMSMEPTRLLSMTRHSTTRHSTMRHSTTRRSTMRHSTMRHSTMRHSMAAATSQQARQPRRIVATPLPRPYRVATGLVCRLLGRELQPPPRHPLVPLTAQILCDCGPPMVVWLFPRPYLIVANRGVVKRQATPRVPKTARVDAVAVGAAPIGDQPGAPHAKSSPPPPRVAAETGGTHPESHRPRHRRKHGVGRWCHHPTPA